ncbi:hypothetical protein [Oceanobacillus iheyensis HTE831]|uniref:Uncharacterized protein n=1 Tax=Oceanobacillus iheyensis (strain DSM 14371 / CIP 107618 / JCM 11309 / KCTC 3954 / HTE831) TaxID=221109 RepID=Q8EM69_OCEIH|nr:hypothetical protein [Oceanobacillus iheyensis HTE831]
MPFSDNACMVWFDAGLRSIAAVPADFTLKAGILLFNNPSAIGLRQVFPVHINKTFIINPPLIFKTIIYYMMYVHIHLNFLI